MADVTGGLQAAVATQVVTFSNRMTVIFAPVAAKCSSCPSAVEQLGSKHALNDVGCHCSLVVVAVECLLHGSWTAAQLKTPTMYKLLMRAQHCCDSATQLQILCLNHYSIMRRGLQVASGCAEPRCRSHSDASEEKAGKNN